MYVFSSQMRLTKLHITCEGTIEDDGHGMLQVRSREDLRRLPFPMEVLLLLSVCRSLWRKSITEPRRSGDFQPECLLLLKRPLREPLTRCRGPGSRPLSLFCSPCFPFTLTGSPAVHFTFCLPLVAPSWQLTRPHDRLGGHSAARIDGRSTGKGMLLTARQGAL